MKKVGRAAEGREVTSLGRLLLETRDQGIAEELGREESRDSCVADFEAVG